MFAFYSPLALDVASVKPLLLSYTNLNTLFGIIRSLFGIIRSLLHVFCSVKHEDKSDVYDIGVVLLEIILGRPIMFQNEVGILKDLVSSFLSNDALSKRI